MLAVTAHTGRVRASRPRGRGKAPVKGVRFCRVLVAGSAIYRDHRGTMRRAVAGEFLVAVDALQRTVNGFRRDLFIHEERDLFSALGDRERMIAMAFETCGGG